MYSVKEIFYTLQGEGFHAGRPAVFLRFSGCNLWTGREEDRHKAICTFCDTDFVGTDGENGGKYNAVQLVEKVLSLWPDIKKGKPFVVCTGGEPLLQLDELLIQELHRVGFEIAIETNGTIALLPGIDWVCLSPKPNTQILIHRGNELKFIFPQSEIHPSEFENFQFDHFYIQAMDNINKNENIKSAIDFVQQNPKWRLSLQTHKIVGIK